MNSGKTSLLAKLWIRLKDRDKFPRFWWYPRKDCQVLDRENIQHAQEACNETVVRTMFTLLATAAFLLLATESTPDRWILLPDEGKFKVPYAEVPVSFYGFMVVGPLLLAIITMYLHIFYGYWLELEWKRQESNRDLLAAGKPLIECSPSLFSLKGFVPRLLTNFVLYWLPLLVLAVMARKQSGLLWYGRLHMRACLLIYFTGITAFILVFLQIRRCEVRRMIWNVPRWTLLILIGLVTIHLALNRSARRSVYRPLELWSEDLKGANLIGEDLPGAYLSGSHLEKADLYDADLSGAELTYAHLAGASLRSADLRKAELYGTGLEEVDLNGTRLEGAQGLTASQVKLARNWEKAFYSPELLQKLGLPPNHNEELQRSSWAWRSYRWLGPEQLGESIRDSIIVELFDIAAAAYEYRVSHGTDFEHRSYSGYKIPSKLPNHENAEYSAAVSPDSITVVAVSRQNAANQITVVVGDSGALRDWTYAGDFKRK